MYNLWHKTGKDGVELALTLSDSRPPQVLVTVTMPDGTLCTAHLAEEDALEVAAVITQSL